MKVATKCTAVAWLKRVKADLEHIWVAMRQMPKHYDMTAGEEEALAVATAALAETIERLNDLIKLIEAKCK